MKVGDIGTELTFIIKDESDNIIDLTGVESATLSVYLGGIKFVRNCIFGDKTKGEVKYIIIEDDLFTSGTILLEVNIHFLDGDIYTTNIIRDNVENIL